NTFTHTEANELAKICGLRNTSSIRAYNELIKYFNTSYNEYKSKILVDFLKLGSEYIFKRHIDIRPEKEVITAKYGEEIKSLGFIHDYQKRVKDEVMLRLGQRTEKTFFLQMPTGAGKTLTALECVCDVLRKTPVNTPTERPDNTHFIVWLV